MCSLKGARGAFGAGGWVDSDEWERLGATRWGRPSPQKLPGLPGGEREKRQRLCGVEGRLAEEARLEMVSPGEMVAWRCRSANTSSSDDVGEGVGVGDGTGEG